MTTRLLVSVRDRSEALEALAAGAEIIDLKEPRRGSLGAVDATVMRDVVAAIDGRVPVTAAIGELLEADAPQVASVANGIALAKFGLAGCGGIPDWPARFADMRDALPTTTGTVAVVYADWQQAQAPPPAEVLRQGSRLDCQAVLVDTWCKSGGGLLELWSLAECREMIQSARDAGLLAVLAGSLTFDAIAQLLPLGPDCVAVRGAACVSARDGQLDPHRVERLSRIVRENRSKGATAEPVVKRGG